MMLGGLERTLSRPDTQRDVAAAIVALFDSASPLAGVFEP
jgi:hypothetical protein